MAGFPQFREGQQPIPGHASLRRGRLLTGRGTDNVLARYPLSGPSSRRHPHQPPISFQRLAMPQLGGLLGVMATQCCLADLTRTPCRRLAGLGQTVGRRRRPAEIQRCQKLEKGWNGLRLIPARATGGVRKPRSKAAVVTDQDRHLQPWPSAPRMPEDLDGAALPPHRHAGGQT